MGQSSSLRILANAMVCRFTGLYHKMHLVLHFASRCIIRLLSASQRISAHLSASQPAHCISLHLDALFSAILAFPPPLAELDGALRPLRSRSGHAAPPNIVSRRAYKSTACKETHQLLTYCQHRFLHMILQGVGLGAFASAGASGT
eukprot:6206915-Pleurochrysis_carterae.AAC.1